MSFTKALRKAAEKKGDYKCTKGQSELAELAEKVGLGRLAERDGAGVSPWDTRYLDGHTPAEELELLLSGPLGLAQVDPSAQTRKALAEALGVDASKHGLKAKPGPAVRKVPRASA